MIKNKNKKVLYIYDFVYFVIFKLEKKEKEEPVTNKFSIRQK